MQNFTEIVLGNLFVGG